MLASNQPYGRVSDGIGAGLFSGALVGAAAAGGVDAFGMSGLDKLSERRSAKFDKQKEAFVKSLSNSSSDVETLTNQLDKHANKFGNGEVRSKKLQHYHGKAFGGWKGRAASYGGSILAGAAIGGATDAIF